MKESIKKREPFLILKLNLKKLIIKNQSKFPFLSRFAFMKGILPKYFNSQWGFAKVKIGDKAKLCGFATKNLFTSKYHKN